MNAFIFIFSFIFITLLHLCFAYLLLKLFSFAVLPHKLTPLNLMTGLKKKKENSKLFYFSKDKYFTVTCTPSECSQFKPTAVTPTHVFKC